MEFVPNTVYECIHRGEAYRIPHYCTEAHLHHCGEMLCYSQRSVPLIEGEYLKYKDVFFEKSIGNYCNCC